MPTKINQVNSDNPTLQIPKGLSRKGRNAAMAILRVLQGKAIDGKIETGGCRLFYSPKEWKERGEEYGTDAALVVVYDGGDAYNFFSFNTEAVSYLDAMTEALKAVGVHSEACTGWYSAVYE